MHRNTASPATCKNVQRIQLPVPLLSPLRPEAIITLKEKQTRLHQVARTPHSRVTEYIRNNIAALPNANRRTILFFFQEEGVNLWQHYYRTLVVLPG